MTLPIWRNEKRRWGTRMVRDCVVLRRDGAVRPLTSAECVIRTAFGDQAIIVVSACFVPSKGNLLFLYFWSSHQVLCVPCLEICFFLSLFLMWITLYYLMLPINHSFALFRLSLSFLLFPLLLLSSTASAWVPLPSCCMISCLLKFHRGGERKSWELCPLEAHHVMSDIPCNGLLSVSESTNTRVLYFSIFSMCCLIGLATWQVFYLRRFFKAKKLIE